MEFIFLVLRVWCVINLEYVWSGFGLCPLRSDIAQKASAVFRVCCCVLSTALLADTTKMLFFVDFSTEVKWHNKVVVVIELNSEYSDF